MSGVAQILLGVDPGIRGGLAVVAVEDGAAPRLVEVIDIPVIGTGAKERVDVITIRNFIDRHQPIRALIERAQAMPKQGSSSGFKYGRAEIQNLVRDVAGKDGVAEAPLVDMIADGCSYADLVATRWRSGSATGIRPSSAGS